MNNGNFGNNCYVNANSQNKPQPLHYLYLGRLLSTQDHYSGDTTYHEEHDKLMKQREIHRRLYVDAMKREENISRYLGGKPPKVLHHPAVEPEALIEDPDLRNIVMSNGMEDNNINPMYNIENFEDLHDYNEYNDFNDKKEECGGNCGIKESYISSNKKRNNSNFAIGCSICIVIFLIIVLIGIYSIEHI